MPYIVLQLETTEIIIVAYAYLVNTMLMKTVNQPKYNSRAKKYILFPSKIESSIKTVM